MILVVTMVKMITDDLPDNADDNNKNGHYTAHRAVVRSVSSY